jgi:hypothetical protein
VAGLGGRPRGVRRRRGRRLRPRLLGPPRHQRQGDVINAECYCDPYDDLVCGFCGAVLGRAADSNAEALQRLAYIDYDLAEAEADEDGTTCPCGCCPADAYCHLCSNEDDLTPDPEADTDRDDHDEAPDADECREG